jgi:2-polyprenyl-3-methyl-5-hydroxy-6-metoxy-1,4-benzoquinol methylase
MTEGYREYSYQTPEQSDAHDYLLPAVTRMANAVVPPAGNSAKIFELGCGNGAVANVLAQQGYQVSGIDYSDSAIQIARKHFPHLQLAQASVYEDLAAVYGQFPLVLSLEVVEHLYFPRQFAKTMFELLEPGGHAIISTPYHGYWKNLVLALSGKLDAHFTVLWDGGHIKFWSVHTLSSLLQEAGFIDIKVTRVGRIPPLAKSMIMCVRKPGLS